MSIYHWKRRSIDVSTAQKKNLNDPTVWASKVEAATNLAVAKVTGKRSRTKDISALSDPLEEELSVVNYDLAYKEAQDLLATWMEEKVDIPKEVNADEAWLDKVLQMPVTTNGKTEDEDFVTSVLSATSSSFKPKNFKEVAEIENKYELMTVDKVIEDIVNRNLNENRHVLNDIGPLAGNPQPKPSRNPMAKMDMRHQKIKQQKQARAKEREERELKKKLEVEAAAKNLIIEEEKAKIAQKKAEELALQQEMEKIREDLEKQKALFEQKRKAERKLSLAEEQKRQLLQEQERQSEKMSSIIKERNEEERKRKEEAQTIIVNSLISRRHLVCLQRHLTAWRSFLMEQRLKSGKFVALYEWRLLTMTFSSWRARAKKRQLEKEAESHARAMQLAILHSRLAYDHYIRTVTRRAFGAWKTFVRLLREDREANQASSLVQKKAAALVDALQKKQTLKDDENSAKKTKSRDDIPVEAWQVTRKHVNLTKEQLQDLAAAAKQSPKRETSNSFSRQQAFQQKQLNEQQRQLKQQTKMINELQKKILNRQNVPSIQQLSERVDQVETGSISESSRSSDLRLSTTRSIKTPRVTTRSNSIVKVDPVVKSMEERERIRLEKKAIIETERKQRELEKQAQIKKDLEERRRLEEEEKRALLEQKRAEKLLEKQREREKQKRLEQISKVNEQLSVWYRKWLLRHYGFSPWIKMMRKAGENDLKALEHWKFRLLSKCFKAWCVDASNSASIKNRMANECYDFLLLKRYFSSWTRVKLILSIQTNKARRLRESTLQKKFFNAWRVYTDEKHVEMLMKEEIAVNHNDVRLLRICMSYWRRLPELLREERRRLAARQRLREQVSCLLTDYEPVKETLVSFKDSQFSSSQESL